MIPTPQGLAAASAGPAVDRPKKRFRWFYMAVGVLMTLIVVSGFWKSFFGPLLGGTAGDRHWVLYAHAVVFMGWLGLFIGQAALVYRRRKDLHRRLGDYGVWYGVLVIALGLAATFVAPPLHVASGRWTMDYAAAFLLLPLGDVLLFGGFFAAAVRFKNRHALHKRLMVLATVALAFPGAARLLPLREAPLLVLLVWLCPLLLAMAFDAATRKRVERVYLVGGAILVVAFFRILLVESEGWLWIGRGIMRILT
jgi:hypothetical protein